MDEPTKRPQDDIVDPTPEETPSLDNPNTQVNPPTVDEDGTAIAPEDQGKVETEEDDDSE